MLTTGAKAPYNETYKNVIEEFIMKHNVIFAVVLAAISFGSKAASFDCAKASSKYEHYICNNPSISYLDEQLTAAYKDAVKVDPAQKGYQREWNKHVRNFTIDHYDLAAVENSYHHRIAALRQVAKPVDLVDSANQTEEIKEGTNAVVADAAVVKEQERKDKATDKIEEIRWAFLKTLDDRKGEKLDLFEFQDEDILGMFVPEERDALVKGFADANDHVVKMLADGFIDKMDETCKKYNQSCNGLVGLARLNPHEFMLTVVSGNDLIEMKAYGKREARRLMKKLRERYGHTEMTIQFGKVFDSEDVKNFIIRNVK